MRGPELSAERPFPGLRPYSFDDHGFFFGREEQTYALYRLIDRSRFIAVVGSSGGGKSSLVRAGLLPLLEEETSESGGHSWRWSEMRPGDSPLEALADALMALAPKGEDPAIAAARRDRIAFTLRLSSFGLADALREIDGLGESSVVLVVDQFEELFRYGAAGASHNRREAARWREEAAQFVQLLLEIGRDRRRAVHVLITMRSDFIGDCARFHGLPEAVSATQFLVPSLTRDQLDEVIRAPIEKAGATIDPALVERLLNDAGDDLDQLPVLQHCLMRLWERAGRDVPAAGAGGEGADAAPPGRHLNLDHYVEIGGIAHALSWHAEEVLRDLAGRELAVEQVFRALSEIDREGRATRRSLTFARLHEETGVSEDDLRAVVDRFRAEDCSFLVPPPSLVAALGPETRIDVGHEALLRRWERVSAEPSAAAGMITDTSQMGWLWAEENDGRLYRGLLALLAAGTRTLPLDQIEGLWAWWTSHPRTAAWAERHGGGFDQVEQLFEESLAALEAARADARSRRLWRNIAAMTIAIMFVLLATGLVFWQRQEALRKLDEAQRAATEQQARAEMQASLTARAQEAEQRATEQKQIAEAQRTSAQEAEQRATEQKQIAEAQRAAAQAAEERATEQKQMAEAERDRAEKALAAAKRTVNRLIFDLAREFRDRAGMPVEMVRKILDLAQDLQHQLAAAGETTPDLQRSESVALNELVATLLIQGDTKTALDAAQRSLGIMESLTTQDSTNETWQEDLSISYELVGDVLVEFGRNVEALESYRKSLAIRARLAASAPSNTGWQRSLSLSYERIGDVLIVQGKREEALDVYQKNVAIREKLTAADPKNTGWQRDLSIAFDRTGDVLFAQGKRDEALEAYRKSLAIRQTLSGSDPGNVEWQRDLSVSHNKVGDVLADLGKRDEAAEEYRKGLVIAQKLATADRGNSQWQRDLSISYERIGNVMLAQGHYPEALDAYRKSLAIIEKLSAGDTNNAQWQRHVSISYEKVGDVLYAQGSLDDSLAAYRKSLEIIEILVASDSENATWQRHISISYEKIAKVLVDQGKREEALEAYRKCLAVREKLTARDPGNTQWQRDLSFSFDRMSETLEALGRFDEVLEIYRKEVAFRRGLAAREPDDAARQRDLGEALDRVSDFLLNLTRAEEAMPYLDENVRLTPENGGRRWRRARAEMHIGRAQAAVDDMLFALKLNPEYPYYVLWLHMARTHAAQEDRAEFAANAEKVDKTKWPWPVVAMLLGTTPPEAMRTAALAGENEATRRDQVCEADFYLAIRHLESGAKAQARPLLESAVANCPHNFVEYSGAKLELKAVGAN